MKALCWYGKYDVRIQDVPEPKILNPRDAIIKVTTTAICGSDLHLKCLKVVLKPSLNGKESYLH